MSEDLKACPLCKSSNVREYTHGQFDSQREALCRSCGCSAPIAVWNHRALDTEVESSAFLPAQSPTDARADRLADAVERWIWNESDEPVKEWAEVEAALKAYRAQSPTDSAVAIPERAKCQACGGDCVAYSRVDAMSREILAEEQRHKDVERRWVEQLTAMQSDPTRAEALEKALEEAMERHQENVDELSRLGDDFSMQALNYSFHRCVSISAVSIKEIKAALSVDAKGEM